MIAMPTIVAAVRERAERDQPISVAQTRWTYVNGVSAEAGGALEREDEQEVPERADHAADDEHRDVLPGHRDDPVDRKREHDRHRHAADQRRVEQQHARILAGASAAS